MSNAGTTALNGTPPAERPQRTGRKSGFPRPVDAVLGACNRILEALHQSRKQQAKRIIAEYVDRMAAPGQVGPRSKVRDSDVGQGKRELASRILEKRSAFFTVSALLFIALHVITAAAILDRTPGHSFMERAFGD